MLSFILFVDVLNGPFTKGFPVKFSVYALSPPTMEHLKHQCKIFIPKTEVNKLGTFRHRWEDNIKILFIVALQPYLGQGRVIVEVLIQTHHTR